MIATLCLPSAHPCARCKAGDASRLKCAGPSRCHHHSLVPRVAVNARARSRSDRRPASVNQQNVTTGLSCMSPRIVGSARRKTWFNRRPAGGAPFQPRHRECALRSASAVACRRRARSRARACASSSASCPEAASPIPRQAPTPRGRQPSGEDGDNAADQAMRRGRRHLFSDEHTRQPRKCRQWPLPAQRSRCRHAARR